MFASYFENASLASWETKSVVVHATATMVQGPYQIQEVVLRPRKAGDASAGDALIGDASADSGASAPLWDSLDCHNPTVHKIGDEYVIFYIGVGVNPSEADVNNASADNAERPHTDLPQSIGAAYRWVGNRWEISVRK
jgi:hypothetical protein